MLRGRKNKAREGIFISSFKFYFKSTLVVIWLFIAGIISLPLSVVFFGQPRVMQFFMRLFCIPAQWICGIKVKAVDKQYLTQECPVVFIGNHQSSMDVVLAGHLHPGNVVIIGKKEVAWVPIFGQLFWTSGSILLDRKNRTKSISTLEKVVDEVMTRNVSVAIMPEGTRNNTDQTLLPFKKGAFHIAIAAQIPIVPFLISKIGPVYQKGSKLGPGEVTLKFLKPIPTKGLKVQDIDQLLKSTRDLMEQEINKISV